MIKWLKIFLGLKGSWKWACKQMDKGFTITLKNSGTVRYKLDEENQRRIIWAFLENPEKKDWQNAFIFLADFETTDWILAR